MIRARVIAFAWLVMIGSQISADPTTQPIEQDVLRDTIEDNLLDARTRPAGIWKHGPVSLIDPLWKQLNEQTRQIGLDVHLAYTVLYQAASGGPGERDVAAGDIDLFGEWRLLGAKDDPNRGLLYFAAENRHELFTPIAPAALKGEIGSLWKTTDGFNEQVLTLREVYWQQHIADDRATVRVGKIDAKNYYSNNY